jgi:hypothetical protein
MNRSRRFALLVAALAFLALAVLVASAAAAARGVVYEAPALVPIPTETELSCGLTALDPGDSTVCSATVTDALPNSLVPTGEVDVVDVSQSRHLPTDERCTLRGISTSQARCQVGFGVPPFIPGLHGKYGSSAARFGTVMHAAYEGDAAHLGSRSAPMLFAVGSGGGSAELAAPETKINHRPPHRTRSDQATFTFTSNQPDAWFQCRLDRGRFHLCRSPKRIAVAPGHHVLEIEAMRYETADPTPARFSWTVLRGG